MKNETPASPTEAWFEMRYFAAESNGATERAEEIAEEFLDWMKFQSRYDFFEIRKWKEYVYEKNLKNYPTASNQ